MPLYEFQCEKCDRHFEQLCDNIEASSEVRCPRCDSRRVQRLLSTFAMSVRGGRTSASSSACSSCSATSCSTCSLR